MVHAWFSLGRLLRRHAVTIAQRRAILWPGGSLTYADLDMRTDRLANAIIAHGIKSGDRVAILSENSPEYVEWILALAKVGAICVPLNVRLNLQEMLYILEDADVSGLVVGRWFLQQAAALADQHDLTLRVIVTDDTVAIPQGWIPHESLVNGGSPQPAVVDVPGEATSVLLYTSGTTGRPKGCMLSHRAWLANGANLSSAFGICERDVYLATLPFFHVAGLGTMLAHLHRGGMVLPFPKWDPEQALLVAREFGVTTTFLVPPMLSQLVDAAGESNAVNLRVIIGGAGFEPPERVTLAEERFGATFYGIYGQTEAGNIVTAASGDQIRSKPGTYGTLLPLFDFRLVGDEGRDLGTGEVGELVLRGPSRMSGYWKNERATQECFENGWLRTGDLFVLDQDGHLRMVDRAKYLIKTGGENVYPQEVELVLLEHPAVADAAVVGVPDPHWGEAVKAFVVRRPGAIVTGTELSRWVRSRLAPYKRPRYVEFIPEIPRNHSGKVLKEELKKRPIVTGQRVD